MKYGASANSGLVSGLLLYDKISSLYMVNIKANQYDDFLFREQSWTILHVWSIISSKGFVLDYYV